MKKLLFLSLIINFLTQAVFAQTAPGYVVLENQDTLFTQIVTSRYHPESGYIPHAKKVFTVDHPDHRVDYSVNEVSAFGFITNKLWHHFRRKAVKANGQPHFMQLLVDGNNAGLYVWTMDAGGAQVSDFIIEDNRRPEHPMLYYSSGYFTDDLKRDLMTFFGFPATLGRILDAGMKKNRWNDREMINIFIQYNKEQLQ